MKRQYLRDDFREVCNNSGHQISTRSNRMGYVRGLQPTARQGFYTGPPS
jgi:hypothetical protein